MVKARHPLVVLLVAVGLIAAGCGGDDDAADEATGSDTPAAESGAEATGAEGVEEEIDEGGDETAVEQTVRVYMVAAANGDADRACALFSDAGREFITRSFGEAGGDGPSCEEIFELVAELQNEGTFEIGGEQIPVDELDSVELDVELTGEETARVEIEGESEAILLERVDGSWRISGFSG